jgi:cytochrome c heme-lyase
MPEKHEEVNDDFPSEKDAKRLPDQRFRLHTEPIVSEIPKKILEDGSIEYWKFPSPQRYYNALRKKSYQAQERDMAPVVSIHNTMNVRAWRQVLEYERFHTSKCKVSVLTKFKGRPGDLSLKARVNSWLGYTTPYDRHDWYVDRCGRPVTYILDFYDGSGTYATDNPSPYIDVRPTVDGVGSVLDRARMAWKELFKMKK